MNLNLAAKGLKSGRDRHLGKEERKKKVSPPLARIFLFILSATPPQRKSSALLSGIFQQ